MLLRTTLLLLSLRCAATSPSECSARSSRPAQRLPEEAGSGVVLLQTRQGMSSDLSSLAAVRPDFFEDASSGQDDFATATSSAASAATVGSAAVAPMSLATSKTVDAASSATPQGVHLPSALSLEKLSSGLQPAPGLEDDTSADWTALRNGIEAGLWAAAEADRPALKLPESALQTVAAPAAPEVQQAEPDVDRSGSSLSAFASLLPKPGRSAAHSSGMHNEKAAAAGPSHRAGAKDVRAPPVLIQPLQEALAQKTEKVAAKKPLVRPMAPSRSSPPATVHHKKATNVPQVAAAQPLESASHEGLPAKTTELLDLETAATAPEAAAEMPVHYRDTSASGQEVLQHAWSSEQDLMQQMQTGSAPEAGAEMPVHYREARASGGAWSSERDLMQQQQMLEQLQHQQMLSQQQMVQQPQLQDWLQQPQPAPIQQQLLQQPPQLQEWPQQAPMKGAASFAQAEQQVSASLTSEAEMCQPYCGLPDYIPVTCQSYCTAGSTAGYMAPNYAVPVAAAPPIIMDPTQMSALHSARGSARLLDAMRCARRFARHRDVRRGVKLRISPRVVSTARSLTALWCAPTRRAPLGDVRCARPHALNQLASSSAQASRAATASVSSQIVNGSAHLRQIALHHHATWYVNSRGTVQAVHTASCRRRSLGKQPWPNS
eukprot:CAMPEP_0178415012 /NCGR_PEP_ID=MMETSP0689_2-20121128/23332_1 /TAXON_ID=160604 /ORGANISM="Amphidinium massartii, Strain CS-259" /LENGTH=659 /DNA_ID=CAMNT_0020036319 /DNA_START=40 /DNA_END=2017 /DNA_ORIENTATION=+